MILLMMKAVKGPVVWSISPYQFLLSCHCPGGGCFDCMLCALAEKEDHRKVSSSLITGNTALSLDKNDFAIVTDNLLL